MKLPKEVYLGLLKTMAPPLVILTSLALAGCAPILLAGAGAVAGYVVSRDSVTIDLERPWDNVWQACLKEVNRQGRVKRENRLKGRIDARIRETDVVVTLESLTPATVRVVIRARKNLLPHMEVAQRLGSELMRRVK